MQLITWLSLSLKYKSICNVLSKLTSHLKPLCRSSKKHFRYPSGTKMYPTLFTTLSYICSVLLKIKEVCSPIKFFHNIIRFSQCSPHAFCGCPHIAQYTVAICSYLTLLLRQQSLTIHRQEVLVIDVFRVPWNKFRFPYKRTLLFSIDHFCGGNTN